MFARTSAFIRRWHKPIVLTLSCLIFTLSSCCGVAIVVRRRGERRLSDCEARYLQALTAEKNHARRELARKRRDVDEAFKQVTDELAATEARLAQSMAEEIRLTRECDNWRGFLHGDHRVPSEFRLRALNPSGINWDSPPEEAQALINTAEQFMMRAFFRDFAGPEKLGNRKLDNGYAVYRLGDDFLVAGRIDWRVKGDPNPLRPTHWIYSDRRTNVREVGGHFKRLKHVQFILLPIGDYADPAHAQHELLWQTLMGFAQPATSE